MRVEHDSTPVTFRKSRLDVVSSDRKKERLFVQSAENLPILKEHFGDLRFNLAGMSSGLLQVMHPGIGAGVFDHSDFIRDPWGRIDRSMPQIGEMIYDPAAQEKAIEVRNKHKLIQGKDEKNRKYHAYDPETFWWAHDTFVYGVEKKIDVFDHRELTPGVVKQLNKESNQWYGMYGLSDRPVPEDYASLQKKRNYIYDNVLEMTPVAEAVITKLINGKVECRPEISKLIWNMGLKIPGNELLRLLAIGGLPPRVRDRFEIPWSRFDAIKFTMVAKTVRSLWPRESRMEWPSDIRDPRFASWAQVQDWERENHASNKNEHVVYSQRSA